VPQEVTILKASTGVEDLRSNAVCVGGRLSDGRIGGRG
jgi:hypothetical protein